MKGKEDVLNKCSKPLKHYRGQMLRNEIFRRVGKLFFRVCFSAQCTRTIIPFIRRTLLLGQLAPPGAHRRGLVALSAAGAA